MVVQSVQLIIHLLLHFLTSAPEAHTDNRQCHFAPGRVQTNPRQPCGGSVSLSKGPQVGHWQPRARQLQQCFPGPSHLKGSNLAILLRFSDVLSAPNSLLRTSAMQANQPCGGWGRAVITWASHGRSLRHSCLVVPSLELSKAKIDTWIGRKQPLEKLEPQTNKNN